MRFNMQEIHQATKNSPALKIRQGGFNTVYIRTLDVSTVVAVKCAKKSIYDNNLCAEFLNEFPHWRRSISISLDFSQVF